MEKREKKVTFSQFQKLGKILMTPVMILPIAGILVGIGSAFTTKNIVALWPVLGNTYVKLFFNLLKAMGNTVNSYLPIIFAVSVAIGYAEKEKGIAALSSVIGFLAMNNVMNILLTSPGILDPAQSRPAARSSARILCLRRCPEPAAAEYYSICYAALQPADPPEYRRIHRCQAKRCP